MYKTTTEGKKVSKRGEIGTLIRNVKWYSCYENSTAFP